jgi:hypothetical protein
LFYGSEFRSEENKIAFHCLVVDSVKTRDSDSLPTSSQSRSWIKYCSFMQSSIFFTVKIERTYKEKIVVLKQSHKVVSANLNCATFRKRIGSLLRIHIQARREILPELIAISMVFEWRWMGLTPIRMWTVEIPKGSQLFASAGLEIPSFIVGFKGKVIVLEVRGFRSRPCPPLSRLSIPRIPDTSTGVVHSMTRILLHREYLYSFSNIDTDSPGFKRKKCWFSV